MSSPKADKVWMNGKLVPWDDAKIHIGSHVIHYGSAVFEGVRCYSTPRRARPSSAWTPTRSACTTRPRSTAWRSLFDRDAFNKRRPRHDRREQARRLLHPPHRLSRLSASSGVNPLPCPVDAAIMVWEWGKYLGPEALEQGVDVCVSSWTRIAPNTLPTMAKSAANYMNSQLIKMEALSLGYAEGIALDTTGYVSEGSGENIFIVKDGTLITPPLGVLGAARDHARHGPPSRAPTSASQSVQERIPREMLYIADEIFFTGTAAEITPIRSVDKQKIGAGRPGTRDRRAPEGVLRRGRMPRARPVRMAHVRARSCRTQGGCGAEQRRLSGERHAHQRSAEDRVGTEGLRPAPEGRVSSRAAHQRRADPAGGDEAPDAGGHHRHGVLHHEQPPEAEVQGQPRDRHRVLGPRPGPVPLQRLPAARHGGARPARHPREDHDGAGAGPPASSSRRSRRSSAG